MDPESLSKKIIPFAKEHWVKMAIILLLFCFAGVKFQTFNRSYVNRDEPLYAWQSLAIYHNPEMVFSPEINYWYAFALVPAIAAPLNALFDPHLPVRVAVFAFSLLGLLFTYKLGKRVFSKKAGIAAMLLLTLSSCFFYFSTKAMPDVPIMALGTVVLYLLLTVNKKRALAIPPILLAMYAIKTASMVVLPPIAIFLVIKYRKKLGLKYAVLALAATAGLLYIAFLLSPYTWLRPELPPPEAIDLSSYIWFGSSVVTRFSWKVGGIAMAVFALIASIKLRKKMTKETGLLVLWIFLTILPFVLTQTKPDRHYLIAVPAFAVIAGKGVAWLANKKRAWMMAAAIAAIVCLVIASGGYYWGYYRMDARQGILNEKLVALEGWIGENVTEEDKVIIVAQRYYMRGMMVAAEASLPNPRKQMIVNPGKEEFEEIISDKSADHYLIVDSKSYVKNVWLYTQDIWWEDYLQGHGFERKAEFMKQEHGMGLTEDYYAYKKAKE